MFGFGKEQHKACELYLGASVGWGKMLSLGYYGAPMGLIRQNNSGEDFFLSVLLDRVSLL